MVTLAGALKTKPRIDPNRYGRSDRSALGRWFWEIDRVLLLLVTMLIGIGLIAVAAASPAAAERYSGGSVTFPPLYYFYRQIFWIALSVPLMILISMMPRERAKRFSIIGAALFLAALMFVPVIGQEVNGASAGSASASPSSSRPSSSNPYSWSAPPGSCPCVRKTRACRCSPSPAGSPDWSQCC